VISLAFSVKLYFYFSIKKVREDALSSILALRVNLNSLSPIQSRRKPFPFAPYAPFPFAPYASLWDQFPPLLKPFLLPHLIDSTIDYCHHDDCTEHPTRRSRRRRVDDCTEHPTRRSRRRRVR